MSGRVFRVGVVLSPRGWQLRLNAFVADHVDEVELISVRDQRAALESSIDVLLIDETTPWLNVSFVEAAERAQVRLVGVYDRNDGGRSCRELAEVGLVHLLEEAMPPEEVVFLLERLRPTADPIDRHTVEADTGDGDNEAIVVAAGGPTGSGARELAVGLAAAYAGQGWSTVLIDTNETTPGVARRLALGVYPHLLSAIDRARADGISGVATALADQTTLLPFDVIVGIPAPRDWDRVIGTDLDRLIAVCRQRWDRVVLTTSPLVEDLQRWGDRFGSSRRLLAGADVVVGCCEPSPRGVLRYLDWAADVAGLGATVTTVVNKLPKLRRVAIEVARQLDDVGGSLIGEIVEVPFDRRVTAAEWDGTLVARGPYMKAVANLVGVLDGVLGDVEPVGVER